MKKIFFALLAIVVLSSAKAAVNERILKTFNESFPSAQNASWYEYENYAEVYFSNPDNSKCRIRYDNDGKIIYTRRDYDASMLSPFIQSKICNRYSGTKIFGVTEVTSEEELTYHIVLEDDKHWYNVKSDANGRLSLEKKLNKSK